MNLSEPWSGILAELEHGLDVNFSDHAQLDLNADGRLWVNVPWHCFVRIKGLPKSAHVSYNGNPRAPFIDIILDNREKEGEKS